MRKFFRSAAFLAVAGIIAKLIGALYKVPLVSVLGAEGIGIYQLVFPIYTTLLTVSSGGIPQAVSRSTARALAENKYRESRRILFVSALSLFLIGIVGSLLMASCSGALAKLQGNISAAPAYVALAPSVLFVSLLAALRGWWQGQRNMFPTAISQLIEQAVKLGLGLWLGAIMLPYGVEYGVVGAVLGITASEFIALSALGIGLLIRKARSGGKHEENANSANLRSLLGDVYKSALPISFGSLVMPLLQLIDSVMIVNILMSGGLSVSEATALFGVSGVPSAIINLPTVITGALSASLMPKFAAALKKGEPTAEYSDRAFTVAHIAGIGGAAIMCVYARELISLLYSGGLTSAQIDLAAVMLQISSVGVIFLSYMQIVTTYLQAGGKAHIPAINLFIGGCVKAGLTALLLVTVGIEGSAIATVTAYAVTFALDFFAVRKCFGGSARPMLMTLLSAAVASAVGIGAKFIPLSSEIAMTATALVIFSAAFGIMLVITRVIDVKKWLCSRAEYLKKIKSIDK